MVGELNREGGSPGSLATDFLASSIPPHTVLLSEGEGDGRRGIQLHCECQRGPGWSGGLGVPTLPLQRVLGLPEY